MHPHRGAQRRRAGHCARHVRDVRACGLGSGGQEGHQPGAERRRIRPDRIGTIVTNAKGVLTIKLDGGKTIDGTASDDNSFVWWWTTTPSECDGYQWGTAADLTPGTVVGGLQVHVTRDGLSFDDIELVKPAAAAAR